MLCHSLWADRPALRHSVLEQRHSTEELSKAPYNQHGVAGAKAAAPACVMGWDDPGKASSQGGRAFRVLHVATTLSDISRLWC